MEFKVLAPNDKKLINIKNQILSDDLIYLNNSIISNINPRFDIITTHKPWKNILIKVQKSNSKYSIYKKIFGASNFGLDKDKALMSFTSLNQLNLKNGEKIKIIKGNQILYRHMFYYNHLNDAVRVSYKVGIYGLIFGILGFAATIILS